MTSIPSDGLYPTLIDALTLCVSGIAPEIAGPEAISRLRDAAQWLPFFPVLYLEIRLNGNASRVDLAQYIPASCGGSKALANHIESLSLDGDIPPVWRKLRRLCKQWNNPESPVHGGIEGVWLEVDMDSPILHIPEPSIFMAFHRNPPAPEKAVRAVEAALSGLTDFPIHPGGKRMFLRIFEACGKNAAVIHTGVWLARQTQELRVIVKGDGNSWISQFLKAIDWPGYGSWDTIKTEFDKLFDFADTITLAIDVGEKVFPGIGLEFAINDPGFQMSGWKGIFDELTTLELCDKTKRDAVLKWPDQISPRSVPDKWPEHLIIESLLRRPDEFSIFHRSIGHVKVVIRPDLRATAKGYLAFSHSWINPWNRKPADRRNG